MEIGGHKLTKTEINLEDFDFGFTTASAKAADASSTVNTVQAKMDALFNAVMPLLNNLQKNPEKEYILWPDRHNKVEQFRDKLTILYKS